MGGGQKREGVSARGTEKKKDEKGEGQGRKGKREKKRHWKWNGKEMKG